MGLPNKGMLLVGAPLERKQNPRNVVDGQFSGPFVVGCAINLIATVDAAGFGDQAGVVEFRRNGVAIGQANVALTGANPVTGTATLALDDTSTPFSAAALPGAGTAHTLTAHFLGAGNYAASSSIASSLPISPRPAAMAAPA